MNLYLNNMERMIKQLDNIIQSFEKQNSVLESLSAEIKKNNQLLDRIQISVTRMANDGPF